MRTSPQWIGAILGVSIPLHVWGDFGSSSPAALLGKRLQTAKHVEVFALEPVSGGAPKAGERQFHSWKVLGSTTLNAKDEMQSEKLKTLLSLTVDSLTDPEKGVGKGCVFSPRHGIRAKVESHQIDLVICLECGDVEIKPGTKRLWLNAKKNDLRKSLNTVLKDAGVTLAEGSE